MPFLSLYSKDMKGNEKSLEQEESDTREVVLCSGSVDAGGARRLIARDTCNLVL